MMHPETAKSRRPSMIGILVVSSQATLRKGLVMRLDLEPDMQVLGEAADAELAAMLAESLQPDVVLLDVDAIEMDAFALLERLSTLTPHSAVVLLGLYDNEPAHLHPQTAGVAAFASKREMDTALVSIVRQVHLPRLD